jgi:hypothetical protein
MTEIFLINMNLTEGSTTYDCVGAEFLKIDMSQYGGILASVLSDFSFVISIDGVRKQTIDLINITDSYTPIDNIYEIYIPRYSGLISYTISYKLLEIITEPKDLNSYILIQ